jgi:hypothetical protein
MYKKTFGVFVFIISLLVLSVSAAQADANAAAIVMCQGLEASNATQCEINHSKSTIDATFNTSDSEARTICVGVANAMANYTSSLRSGGWMLRIFSPYNSEIPIATCKL